MSKVFKNYIERRKKLLRKLGKGSAAIVASAVQQNRNSDVEYLFRQDSDFYYLTGFVEANAWLVLVPGREQGESILFCQDRDTLMEIWNGRRLGWRRAAKALGVDQAINISELDSEMPVLLEGVKRLYTHLGVKGAVASLDQSILSWVKQVKQKSRAGVVAPSELLALSEPLHEMRLFKSKVEVEKMQAAADISAQAHIRAMRFCQPGKKEYQLQAELEYVFNQNGCTTAYPTIVGSGENSCILHYIENQDAVKSGDLVLIDAGAEYDSYAADITRTFPVNGQFSECQKIIYNIVLEAQVEAIKRVKPGNRWDAPHKAAVKVIAKGLKSIGLLQGDLKKIIQECSYRQFYMHNTGHWLGMDVHDVGSYKIDNKWREFKAGMVLTVEPGIYISAKTKGVDKCWWNIGIRIEDDILVTANGNKVLTHKVPKTVKEIEQLVGSGI